MKKFKKLNTGSNGGMRQSNVGNNLVDRNNEPSAKQVSPIEFELILKFKRI